MLPAVLSTAGLAASAVASYMGASREKRMQEETDARARAIEQKSLQNTRDVVANLAPSVVTLSQTVGDVAERTSDMDQNFKDAVNDLNFKRIQNAQDVAQLSADQAQRLQLVREDIAAAQTATMAQMDRVMQDIRDMKTRQDAIAAATTAANLTTATVTPTTSTETIAPHQAIVVPPSVFKQGLVYAGTSQSLQCAEACGRGASLRLGQHAPDKVTDQWTYDQKTRTLSVQDFGLDTDGAAVRTTERNGTDAQRWVIEKYTGAGKGTYQIRSVKTGQCLAVGSDAVQLGDCATAGGWDIADPQRPVQGQSVRCEHASPIEGGVFRYDQGKLRHYPNPTVASTWDREWGQAPSFNCAGIGLGEKMPPRWTPVPGALKQVSSDGTTVCGVNADDKVFCAPTETDDWKEVGGRLRQIAVDGGRACGTDSSNSVFCAANLKEPVWQPVQGTLREVDVSGDRMCGVGIDNLVYCAPFGKSEWQVKPGQLQSLSLGAEGLVCGIDGNNNLSCKTDIDKSEWPVIRSSVKQVDAGSGTVCGVDASGDIFCGTPEGQFRRVDGVSGAQFVTHSGGGLYASDTQQRIYKAGAALT